MWGGSLKRRLGAGSTKKTKMRKENGQVLLETDSFDCIDDVILELRSIEGYVAHVKFDGFRKILEKLEKSSILVRRKQGQDVGDAELRFLSMEDFSELHRLVDEHVPKSCKAKFEEHMDKIGSGDRFVSRQTSHRKKSNHVFETVDIPSSHEPLQQDIFFPQSDQQSIEEGQVIESKQDIPNLHADGGGFLSSSADLEETPENDTPLPMDSNTVRDRSPRGYGDMWSSSDESIASHELLSTLDEVSYRESKIVENLRPRVPFQKDLCHSQANEEDPAPTMITAFLRRMIRGCGELRERQSTSSDEAVEQSAATVKTKQLVDCLKPDTRNFSNNMHNVAQISFNAELLKTLDQFRHELGTTNDIEEICGMIKQRTTLLKDAQCTFSRAEQQQFCLKVLTKLRDFEQKATDKSGATFGSPNLNIIFQKLVDKLQPDAQNYAQFLLPNSMRLADLDLIKCIVHDRNSEAAQHFLRARKLRLKNLSFVLRCEKFAGRVELKLVDSELGNRSAGINHSIYRRFNYGFGESKERSVQLFKIITQLYDVSQASIVVRKYGSTGRENYELLKSTFGPSPVEHSGKIRIKEIIIESAGLSYINSANYYCVFTLYYFSTAGVEMIEFRNINADKLMEKCTAPVVLLSNSTWRKESIFRVLNAHRLSADNGCPRNIRYQCHQTRTGSSVIKDWEELFEMWSRGFEAVHGTIGRRVTMRTVSDNCVDYVAFTLH